MQDDAPLVQKWNGIMFPEDPRKFLSDMEPDKNREMSNLRFTERRKLARTVRFLYTFSLPAQHILSRSSIFDAQAHVST
jgi:hypothetical protein